MSWPNIVGRTNSTYIFRKLRACALAQQGGTKIHELAQRHVAIAVDIDRGEYQIDLRVGDVIRAKAEAELGVPNDIAELVRLDDIVGVGVASMVDLEANP